MKKAKKRVLILVIICLVVLIGAVIADLILGKAYFKEVKFNKLMEMVEKKENFVILISQTTCENCIEYKPKIAKVAKRHKVDVYYIEVDLLKDKEKDELKSHFNYTETPITVFVTDGEEKTAANRIIGNVSEEKVIGKFKSNGLIK